jgi:hypothetical protein
VSNPSDEPLDSLLASLGSLSSGEDVRISAQLGHSRSVPLTGTSDESSRFAAGSRGRRHVIGVEVVRDGLT